MTIVAQKDWSEVMEPTTPEGTLQQTVVLVAATMDAPPYNTPKEKLQQAMDLVLADKVQRQSDGTFTVQGSKLYSVNGLCSCPQSQHGKSKWCKHLVGVEIYKRVQQRLTPPATAQVETLDQPTWPEQAKAQPALTPDQPGTPTIPAWALVTISGKQFVTYGGLLAMAHEKGLTSLSAHFISVTSDLALAEATAEFSDGTTFSECADASPTSVGSKVKAHFPRIACTRAKARALRDGLNIHLVALEELGD